MRLLRIEFISKIDAALISEGSRAFAILSSLAKSPLVERPRSCEGVRRLLEPKVASLWTNAPGRENSARPPAIQASANRATRHRSDAQQLRPAPEHRCQPK